MKLIYIVILYSTVTLFSTYGQVGINTTSPRGVFHIDAQGDTPDTGSPSLVQISNDIIVTTEGRFGIGTITPDSKSKLDINGKIKISDGTQRDAYKLISDATGKAHWDEVKNKMTLVTTLGAGLTTSLTAPVFTLPTGGWIDLPPGPSLVMGTLFAHCSDQRPNIDAQIRFFFSDNSSVATRSNFEYLNDPAGWGFLTVMLATPGPIIGGSGYWAINNKTAGMLRLYLFAQISSSITDGSVSLINVGNGNVPENILVIVPIDEIESL